jgi:hypothetical protein
MCWRLPFTSEHLISLVRLDFAMWDNAIPFYNIPIILISLPSAWLGGQLFLKKAKQWQNKKLT